MYYVCSNSKNYFQFIFKVLILFLVEMNNAGQFYTNRVLKDFKEKSKVIYFKNYLNPMMSNLYHQV